MDEEGFIRLGRKRNVVGRARSYLTLNCEGDKISITSVCVWTKRQHDLRRYGMNDILVKSHQILNKATLELAHLFHLMNTTCTYSVPMHQLITHHPFRILYYDENEGQKKKTILRRPPTPPPPEDNHRADRRIQPLTRRTEKCLNAVLATRPGRTQPPSNNHEEENTSNT